MIVECQSCTTRFQLDDSRIPPQGVRVRCSRCKEAFFLPHPSAGAAPAAAPRSPDMTQDLTRPAQGTRAEAPADESAAAPSIAPAEPEVEEEDWEFSESIPGVSEPVDEAPAEERADASDSSVDDPADDPDGGDAFGPSERFDLTGGAEPDSAVHEGDHESDFELDTSRPDLSLDSFPAGSLPDDDGDALIGRDLEAESGHSGLAAQSDIAMETRADAGAADGADADSELGDPENWDFFAAADAPPEEVDAAAKVDLDWSDDEERAASDPRSSSFVDAPLNIAEGTEVGVGHYLTSGVGIAMRAVGWSVTLALVGFALWTTAQFAPSGAHATPRSQAAVGAMRAEALTATWVDTERLGTVLVVAGQLRNPSPAEASPGMRVEVVLLDEQGEALARDAVAAGTPIERSALRAATQTAVQSHAEAAANALAWTPIAGGESIPFEAVLMDVPYAALRFDVRGEPLGSARVPELSVPLEAPPLVRDAEAGSELGLSFELLPGNEPLVPGH